MMKKADVVIAIDPDVSKSGVARLYKDTKEANLFNLPFSALCSFLSENKQYFDAAKKKVVLLIEASWNTTHNHHIRPGQTKSAAAKTGYNVGRNHQVGMNICEMARSYGLEVIEQPPLRKCWKGRDGKITHEEIVYFTEIKNRTTNQETRDALLIAWNYAGFPIRTKV